MGEVPRSHLGNPRPEELSQREYHPRPTSDDTRTTAGGSSFGIHEFVNAQLDWTDRTT